MLSFSTRFALNTVWTKASDDSGDEENMYEEAKHSEHGAPQRSGKLQVLKQILPLWHEQVVQRCLSLVLFILGNHELPSLNMAAVSLKNHVHQLR